MVWLEYMHLSKLQYLYKKHSNLYFTHNEKLSLERSQATVLYTVLQVIKVKSCLLVCLLARRLQKNKESNGVCLGIDRLYYLKRAHDPVQNICHNRISS